MKGYNHAEFQKKILTVPTLALLVATAEREHANRLFLAHVRNHLLQPVYDDAQGILEFISQKFMNHTVFLRIAFWTKWWYEMMMNK